jgi:hypothetical protein
MGTRARTEQALLFKAFEETSTVFNSLSKKEIKNLNLVINEGKRTTNPATGIEGVWFTPREFGIQFERLTGKVPTEKDQLAYYTFKQQSDLACLLYIQTTIGSIISNRQQKIIWRACSARNE